MVYAQLIFGVIAGGICWLAVSRSRSETFPHGREFLRVLARCGVAALALGVAVGLTQ